MGQPADPMALLAEAAERHGKRHAAAIVARKLTDDPLEREAIAQNLRRRRRKASTCSFAALPSE